MSIATARLIKSPPPPRPLPSEVPSAIEDAARKYVAAIKVADLTHATLLFMDRTGPGYRSAYEDWIERERTIREARRQLVDALGPGEGTWPIGEFIVKQVNRLWGGAELRIEAGCSAWPGRERNR